MRLSELVGINRNDLDTDLRSMRVVGKGNKERVIYLNKACQDSLRAWIRHRMTMESKDTNALFISSRGKRISAKTVQAMVYKYLDRSGLGYRKLSVHKLRHTAATLLYQTGEVDIRTLKEILGHEQLNTTQIYTHVSNASMEDAMKHNPLANVQRKGVEIPSEDVPSDTDDTQDKTK
jgi:site-specific recombinase XerD